MNIIKNIYEAFDIKETDETRYIHIEIIPVEDDSKVRISFKDNASGFDKEIAEKIFERGFTTKESGSGIGMHQCRSIIESHGGTLTIESKGRNTGALTVIELPLKK
jgi:signal transduction histidine kinase